MEMKKRLLFLILLAFLLCGCSANVNITINGDTVSERITIKEATYDIFTINDIAQQYRKYIPAFYNVPLIDTMPDQKEEGVKYYGTSGSASGDVYTAYYQFDYNFKEYKNATSIRNAFKASEVQFDPYEKQILFTTESSGMTLFKSYPQLDEVRVNITTNYLVMETNADYQNGNVYTWIFKKDTQKGIYMLLSDVDGKSIGGLKPDTKKDDDKKEDDKKEENDDDPNASKEPNRPNKKDEENGSKVEKYGESKTETKKKNPFILFIVCCGGILFLILLSTKVQKT